MSFVTPEYNAILHTPEKIQFHISFYKLHRCTCFYRCQFNTVRLLRSQNSCTAHAMIISFTVCYYVACTLRDQAQTRSTHDKIIMWTGHARSPNPADHHVTSVTGSQTHRRSHSCTAHTTLMVVAIVRRRARVGGGCCRSPKFIWKRELQSYDAFIIRGYS